MLLSAPTEVFWCVTNRCNLRCRFCLSRSTRFRQANELNATQREFVLSQLIDGKVLKVYLTGGEPMLCPEIMSYIARLRGAGVFVELTTNATLLNEERIRRLRNLDLSRVQVSLNGAQERTNDALMGKSHRRIWANLALLQKHGLRTHVKVTVVRQNLREIERLVRQLVRSGVDQVDISEVHPLGRAFDNWELLRVDWEDLLRMRENIAVFQKQTGRSVSFHSATLQVYEDGVPAECTAGRPDASACQILPDGNVIPCAFASVWDVSNNIMERGLESCWQAMTRYQYFQNPDLLEGRCATCLRKMECAGGCRALAYLFTGKIWGEYPFCPLNQERVKHEQQKEMAVA